jgi:tetratricopeptide (TPR) repeat protein
MARPRLVLCPLLVLLAASTAGAVDREKLRQAMHLPSAQVFCGYGVSRHGQFASPADFTTPQPEKIAALEKELKGDAGDAERYCRLADLYFQARQPARGKEARRKAVALLREQLAQHPEDPSCLLYLADVLQDPDGIKEAESLARRVIDRRPKDPHAWLLLGEILDSRSWFVITGGDSSKHLVTADPARAIQAARPAPKQAAAARRYHQEAMSCFDRAVALAPHSAEAYRRRGASRYHYGFLEYGLRLSEGEKIDTSEAFLGREALPDLRKAVDLDGQEYVGLGMFVMQELTAELVDRARANPSTKQPEKVIDALSAACRKRLRGDLAVLEKGLQNPDRHKAAEAAEVLGLFQYLLLGDSATAEKTLRRGLQHDPSRTTSWELLASILAGGREYRKLADLCRDRLTQQDSACNRVLLAKAYDYLNQPGKAEEVLRAGLERDPSSFPLELALADLLLMRGDDESVRQAGGLLHKMEQEKPPVAGDPLQWANYTFAWGVYFGLIGDGERARRWLQEVEKHDPHYANIHEALKALDDEAIPFRTSAPCPPR